MPVAIADLRRLLTYDAASGALYWKPRAPAMFAGRKMCADGLARSWNAQNAGKPALTYVDHNGYCVGTIWARPHKAHRVIWAIVHGEWPEEIDHINGDRTDNRLHNLRAVTRAENSKNLKRRADNTSGATGVTRTPNGFRARIVSDGREIYLGVFSSVEEAAAARVAALAAHGFHENHGRA